MNSGSHDHYKEIRHTKKNVWPTKKNVWPTKKRLYFGQILEWIKKKVQNLWLYEHVIKINWNPNIKAIFFLYLGTPVQLSDGQTAVSGVLSHE